MMGKRRADAGPRAGVLAVRDLDAAALSRHRPHQGAAARHQRARRVRRAADLSRLGLRQRLQPVRPHLPRHRAGRRPIPRSTPRTCSRSACAIPAATPCRSARSRPCATSPGRTACRATISIRPPSSMAPRRPAIQPGPGDRDHGEARGRDAAATASATNGRRSPSSRLRAGNTAIFAFVLAVVFVFLVLAAQFESLTLPLAVILIVPMCLSPRSSAWCCAGRTTTSSRRSASSC